MIKNNPLLKTLKNGDVVLFEIPYASDKPDYIIAEISNLKFYPSDEEYDYDWLDFDSKALYSTYRMHLEHLKVPVNCMCITEVFPKDKPNRLRRAIKEYDLMDVNDDPLSDEELDAKKSFVENLMVNL